MRAQFEGQAAERMAAARARVAAQIEAAGGIEAWRAQNAHKQLVADARRRAEEAAQAALRAALAAEKAHATARMWADLAGGQWALTLGPVGRDIPGSYGGGFDTAAGAWAEAERSRAAGRGASVLRPYCGHGLDRLTAADSPCQACAKAGRK